MQAHAGKFWAIGVTALAGLVYGLVLYVESAIAPSGCCFATWPGPNPLQTERLMFAKDPLELNPATQRSRALLALQARPADVQAWLRLAFADRQAHGMLTAEGQKALDASYSVTPYATSKSVWRVLFVLENWDRVLPRTRVDAVKEIRILKGDTALAAELHDLRPDIRDPRARSIALLLGVKPAALAQTPPP